MLFAVNALQELWDFDQEYPDSTEDDDDEDDDGEEAMDTDHRDSQGRTSSTDPRQPAQDKVARPSSTKAKKQGAKKSKADVIAID